MAEGTKPQITGTFGKQPGEAVPLGRWIQSFAEDTIPGETIVSATFTVTRSDDATLTGDDLTAGTPSVTGVEATAGFTKGVHGVDYHVEILATGNGGAVYDADWLVYCREV